MKIHHLNTEVEPVPTTLFLSKIPQKMDYVERSVLIEDQPRYSLFESLKSHLNHYLQVINLFLLHCMWKAPIQSQKVGNKQRYTMH